MCMQAWLLGWGGFHVAGVSGNAKMPLKTKKPLGCLGRNINTTAILVIFIAWFVFTLSLKSKFWVNEQR